MKKIAVIRRNGLGDLLCSLPLVKYLIEKESEITLFVSESNASLLPFITIPIKTVILPVHQNKYLSLLKVAFRHRKTFDIALSAKTSPMKLMNLFLYALKAKKSVAYVDESWHSRLVSHPLFFDQGKSKKMHQALKNLHMVAPHFEEVPSSLFPTLSVPFDLKQKYSFSFPSPCLLINASTTREASRIHEEKYAGVVNCLYEKVPFSTVVLGQPKDEARAKKLASLLKGHCQVFFPRSFEEFMVILDTCDVYFVPDGGIAHIGAGLKKSAVVLFGETNPIEWRPLSHDMDVFFDPHHVNALEEIPIIEALEKKLLNILKRL